ncbi:S-layer homology domain-containing protein [Thermosyntropha lipolytica DSM 11003]|uniref:S-layer homology domain-containing protein n=1 Tax=Thermosyntropha lipolytica DSM 11003 TaxID=1123382 RepID=A0A1M5L5R4_9FIRM|nr:S-layer homology domain-containing protein [Thermosyntropha lipolytica]SHG60300.1 S-layer homology domain-containing protein [Thermosyntropha lipolytica DSM 11003]
MLHFKKYLIIAIILLLLLTPSFSVNAAQFRDIQNHWAEPYISYMAANSYISGYPDGTFRPENHITRVEFLSILLNCIQQKPAYTSKYSTSWTDMIIEEASYQGIIDLSAYPYKLKPYELLTRGEAAFLIAKALNIPPDYSQVPFRDADIINKNPYKPYIKAVYEQGIINGYPTGEFRPYDKITRAQAAVMLKKLGDRYVFTSVSSYNQKKYKYITTLQFDGYKYNPDYVSLYINRESTSYTAGDMKIIDEYNFYLGGQKYNLNSERIGIALQDGVYAVKKIILSRTGNTLLIDSSPYMRNKIWQDISLSDIYSIYDNEGYRVAGEDLQYLKLRINGRSTIYYLDEIKINVDEKYIEIKGNRYDVKDIKIIYKKKYSSSEYEYTLRDIYTRNNQLVFDCY